MHIVKDYKAKFVVVSAKERRADTTAYKRRSRRAYKRYMRTGSMHDYNRANERFVNDWD